MACSQIIFGCLLASFIAFTYACNNCKMHTYSIKDCGKGNAVSMNFKSLNMTDTCMIKPSGKMEIVKKVESSICKVTLSKPLPFVKPNIDLCKELEKNKENKDLQLLAKLLHLRTTCPMKPGDHYAKKFASIESHKDDLKSKAAEGKVECDHGSAGSSCWNFAFDMKC